jgi:hypothetical protein
MIIKQMATVLTCWKPIQRNRESILWSRYRGTAGKPGSKQRKHRVELNSDPWDRKGVCETG